MDVILLERIGKLGQMGDVVTVKDGYARNFLLPQGKALRANKANLARFERERAQLEARNLELKKEADKVAEKINGQSFVVIRQAGDTGQLYGSVSTRDIAEVVTAGGCTIERRQVLLDRPIKVLGLHEVRLSLHPEVEATVTINVARTEEEAERQARGEDTTAFADEYELEHFEEEGEEGAEAIRPEEVFEDEVLAREAEAAALEEAGEAEAGETEAAAEASGKSESGEGSA